MRYIFILFCLLSWCSISLYSQTPDTLKTVSDTNKVEPATGKSLMILKKPYKLKQPTMPPLPALSEKSSPFQLNFRRDYQARHPESSTNWDALNKPGSYKYMSPYRQPVLKPNIPITPLEVEKKPFYQSLPLDRYILPTRRELDILEILWAKENVMDTTIYSCLDTTMNITFEDLNKLLAKMANRGLVNRRIVSPRNEFNMFGVLIEMSPTNRRNRVYEYRSNVDRDLMRRFVDANLYLIRKDSLNRKQSNLRVSARDSTLLKDLNEKLIRAKK